MHSQLADYLRQKLIESHRKMTPTERLKAYINHCEQTIQFYNAGAPSSYLQ